MNPDLSLLPADVLYTDIETTGLDTGRHEIVEIAWACGGGPVSRLVVPHVGLTADPHALAVNGYYRRRLNDRSAWCVPEALRAFAATARGKTLAGSNPGFDAAHLQCLFGWDASQTPWHYRLIDVCAAAAYDLGQDRSLGLAKTVDVLRAQGWRIEQPDHTAAGDVRATQQVHAAVQHMRGRRMDSGFSGSGDALVVARDWRVEQLTDLH